MSKILVSYFSASGITARLAKDLAQGIAADLFEIKPSVPYSKADLDWTNKNSRSTIEMNDKSSRPSIQSAIENFQNYDTIFVGFPIWWYREPSIIDTFIESYDFSGKTIIPFATSGSTDMGDSVINIQNLAPKANVKNGIRFSSDANQSKLVEWAQSFLK